MRSSASPRSRLLPVALVAMLVGLGLALLVIIPAGDPSAVAALGIEDQQILGYAEDRLGDVTPRESIGHDGRFFFVQANDPLLLNPAENAAILDRPTYRTQRMLYPFLAGVGGLATPQIVLWGLIVVNVLAMGAGAAAVARYAQLNDLSRWFGLAFPLNPGLMSELTIDGAGVVAFASLCVAVVAVLRGRQGWAIAFLVLGSLAREVMLVAAAGVALWLWLRGERRRGLLSLGAPSLAVASWAVYVRLRLPASEGVEVQEIGLPFQGLVEAVKTWLDFPTHLAVGAAVVLCLVLFTSHLFRGRSDLLAYATGGFVLVAALLTQQVWEASFDMTRAVAPVFTALIVNPFLFARRQESLAVEA